MHKNPFLFAVLCVFVLSGCSTLKHLESARDRIIELEGLNGEGRERNLELERLLIAERAGNEELQRLSDDYYETERLRLIAERELADRLSGIFKEGSDIIDSLISGYREIKSYLEDSGILVKDIDIGSDSVFPDNSSRGDPSG